jgi:hypothetical protein
MAFETENSKATLIMYSMGGDKIRFSGLVRLTDSNGVTSIRITNQIVTSIVFDDMEIQNPPGSGLNTDVSLTHFSADYSVDLAPLT